MHQIFRIAFASILVSTAIHPAVAEVYRCQQPNGTFEYSNNPYCQTVQPYAKNRQEPLLEVKIRDEATFPYHKNIHVPRDKTLPLSEWLNDLGRSAGAPIEPIGLDDIEVSIKAGTQPWLKAFTQAVGDYDLDYRKAYGRIYIYARGSMGETIVNSPSLLRWYQEERTWQVVMSVDDKMLEMNGYRHTNLKERLPRLLRMVREQLGERAEINGAESVIVKDGYSSGVDSGVAVLETSAQQAARLNSEKERRILERRRFN